MLRFLCALILLVLVPCESRTIVFSAISKVSAEEADKLALAGIAVQIRANVETSRQTEKTEVFENGHPELRTNYSESVSVTSGVPLSGVSFEREMLANGQWKTVATFDTEKAVAAFRRKLLQSRQEAAILRDEIKASIEAGDVRKAAFSLSDLGILQREFKKTYSQMEVFETPDESCSFGVDVRRLGNELDSMIENIGMTFVGKNALCDFCDTIGPISVRVESSRKPLRNVVVTAVVGKEILALEETDSSGVANFFLVVGELLPGENRIDFRIRSPRLVLEEKLPELHINYRSGSGTCGYSLVCSAEENLCPRIARLLSAAGFKQKENAAPLYVRAAFQKRGVFEDGPQPLFRADFSLDISGENVEFQRRVQGVGTSEFQALENAFQKIRPENIRRFLFPFCKIR